MYAALTLSHHRRAAVQVRQVVEGASREEVVFDEVERPLDSGRAVGVALLVGREGKAETLAKSRHLGHRNHVLARPTQDHHVGIVDHAAFGRTAEVVQRVREEDLAGEAVERGIACTKIRASSRAPPTRSGPGAPAAHHRAEGTCRAASPRPARSGSGRSEAPARSRCHAAGRRRSAPGTRAWPPARQFLVDPDQIALAGHVQLPDLLPVGFAFLRRWISGTPVEFERSTLRTVSARPSAPARSRVRSLPSCSVPESRFVAPGSACLSLLLSDSSAIRPCSRRALCCRSAAPVAVRSSPQRQ